MTLKRSLRSQVDAYDKDDLIFFQARELPKMTANIFRYNFMVLSDIESQKISGY